MGAPPKVPVAQSACGSPAQYSVSLPQTELNRRPQGRVSHAVPPLSTAFRGPRGTSTEGPNGAVRMRPPHPKLRFVTPEGAPPKDPVA
eukprot:596438-Pyramimonas_sp.AAC.1